MKPHKFDDQFSTIYDLAIQLSAAADADALLVMLDGPTDWNKLRELAGDEKILVCADHEDAITGDTEAGLSAVILNMGDAPVFEKLTQALLESVADDILTPGARVIGVYSGFEAGKTDSISFIRLDEHLGKLTARDLRKIETSVPLETLKTVVDLAALAVQLDPIEPRG